MADYVKIIRTIAEPMLESPDNLIVRYMDSEDVESLKDVHILVACKDEFLGKLIGRHGSVADAIRTIVNVKARDEHQRVHIKFESFSEINKD